LEEAPQKGLKKIALGERQRYGLLHLWLGRIKGDLFYSLWPGLTLGLAGFPGGEKILRLLPFVGAKLGKKNPFLILLIEKPWSCRAKKGERPG